MPKLTFLHTNDIHGRLHELAHLTTLARREESAAQAEGRTVYRWDAGDAFDRRYEEGRLTRGSILPPVLAAAGVTLQTIGNDIGLVYGLEALTNMVKAARYPILGANLRNQAGPLVEGLQESVLLEGPEGLGIGVIGLTDAWDGAYRVYGLEMPDEFELLKQLVNDLQGRGAQLVVLLSHLGLEADRQVARDVSGIDLIIGAHSHDLLPEGEQINGVTIVQAGKYAEHLGRLDVDVDEQGRVLHAQARVVPNSTDVPADEAVLQALAEVEEQVKWLRLESQGELTAPLGLDHYGESPLANFIAEVLRMRANAEIGLVGSGGLHAPLRAGIVTRGDLANAALVPLNPVVSLVTGQALKAALERSLDPEVVGVKHFGLRGTPFGVLGLSGVEVQIDPTGAVGNRISALRVGGESLVDEKVYRVAHTDLDNTNGTYLRGAGVTEQQTEPVLVEDLLRAHLSRHSPIQVVERKVWHGIEALGDLREEPSA